MPYPNTLIFVDLASDDPAAAATFYSDVFGWENDPRPSGLYHRMVPGQNALDKAGRRAQSATFIWGSSGPTTPGRIPIPPERSRAR